MFHVSAHTTSRITGPRTPLIVENHKRTAGFDLLLRNDVPLLTLIGTGGVGETRLAQQIGADLQHELLVASASLISRRLTIPTLSSCRSHRRSESVRTWMNCLRTACGRL